MTLTDHVGPEMDRRSLLGRFGAASAIGSMMWSSALADSHAGDDTRLGSQVGSTTLPKFCGEKTGIFFSVGSAGAIRCHTVPNGL